MIQRSPISYELITRVHSPLICAEDAVIIDTMMLTINQACLNAASIIENCIKK